MRKTLLACALLALCLLSACGKKPPQYIPPSASAAPTAPAASRPALADSSSSESDSSEPDSALAGDDFSALPTEIQALFAKAQTFYNYFELAPPPTGTEPFSINGQTVYPVLSSSFADYATFYRALEGCFTPDFTEDLFFTYDSYASVGGALYTSMTSRPPNSTFQYAQAEVTSETATELRFTVTAHFYEDYLPEAQRESTKTVDYTAVLTDAGWRFSEFGGYL